MSGLDFSPPRALRHGGESIVPMINVVFLLLIFFLMTAQIAPPVPFEVTPPASRSDGQPDSQAVLYIGPDGALFFEGAEDAAVWTNLPRDVHLVIRADASLAAVQLARLLTRLTDHGLRDVSLVTEGVR